MIHMMERDRIVVKLSGEIDHSNADALRKQLEDVIALGGRDLVLDMEQVTFMDSSGIGVLLGRYRIVRGAGGKVIIRRPNEQVDKLFQLAGIYQIMEKEA